MVNLSYSSTMILVWIFTLAMSMATEIETVSIGNDHESSTASIKEEFCRIPASWHGDWYQYNEHTGGTTLVSINETDISTTGKCGRLSLANAGGGYKHEKEFEMLLISKDRLGAVCWHCMLVFERHQNILQFRISDRCISDRDEVCHTVDINSPMRIMFRANAAVESCPVSGPANFSYSTVTDERCDTHKSTIAGCVDESRLRLNYIACPGMRMESRIDDILCLGKFEAFNKKYFVGRMINKASAGSEGDLHRCFMYETTSSGGNLMMSEDASCQSLDMDQASVKIRYTSVDSTPKPECVFRPWLRHKMHNKDSEIIWESLSSSKGDRHVFDRHKWTVERNNRLPKAKTSGTTTVETINWCIQYVSDHKDEKSTISADGTRLERIIVYTIDECERGYRCVEFYHHPKRTRNQVMDVLMGKFAPTSYEACKPEYFDRRNLHFETLMDSASKEQECPSEHRGQYRIRGCEENDAALFFGCGEKHALIFYEDCNQKSPDLYHCYGDWIDPDNPYVHYLAVKEASTGRKTCFAYAKTAEEDELSMSTFKQHSCHRGILPGINGHRAYNLTKAGLCDNVPLLVANLTQSDASARYDESSLSQRSVKGANTAINGFGHSSILTSFLILLISWILRQGT